MFGKIQNYLQKENKIELIFENKKALIEIVSPSIINFFVPFKTDKRVSKSIENLKTKKSTFKIERYSSKITICTGNLKINIYDEFKVDIYDSHGNLLCEDYRGKRAPFVRNGLNAGACELANKEGHKIKAEANICKFNVLKKLEDNTFFYGFGEKTGHLNKKGYHYKMWNSDIASPHVESFEALYESIPFFIALKDKKAFGIFLDNTFETHFDMGKENSSYYSFGAADGNLNYYFIYGPSVKDVVKNYTYLTGRTPLPALWTLGYHQCRWSYVPESKLVELADAFRNKDIPCDALYLDIDYMDGYRVFTWDKNKFKDPKKTLHELKQKGFKVVTIIDPGVKKDKDYKIYDEGIKGNYFATDKDGIPYVNEVWPGKALYPDFSNSKVRNWWANNQKIMLDCGVSGIWNDMNEPASFNGPLPDDVMFNNDGIKTSHREIHNVYGHYMAKATYEGIKKYSNKRPFVITRACFAGTQKYSTVWTGDNQSLWEHLRMSLPMLMNLGLSGMVFCGTDVGGFGFDCTSELLSRWTQVGCFTPLFRNHSSIFTREQEPWAFDEKTEDIVRKYIKLRYKLIPYLYDFFFKEENDGLPIIRPLLLNYQNDKETYELNDEFLCGDNILVAPIVEQGKSHRMVYLPNGDNWIDYWTHEHFSGGQYIIKYAPIDTCPIYIKSGSIIPNYPVQNYIGEKEITNPIFNIYLPYENGNFSCTHYQDDGESFDYRNGIYNIYKCTVTKTSSTCTIKIDNTKNDYRESYKGFNFNLLTKFKPLKILADEKPIKFAYNDEILKFSTQKVHEIVISQ
ncbi:MULTISPECIES: glycoside hydrolase family 31 protein [Clostridium]|uniref:glycoside hydrolase family 31 protein n=1 Tax=Clostridium TaxID=1485 RepID=UPI00082480AE|nr:MULTISPECIES: glycoside hydrolase family 31 protein [Clostridium]PJI09418.1 alpha-glucosidase [Clostridium sp. CT7]